MNIAKLIADPHQVRVECIITDEKTITVRITTIQPYASCPRCQHLSTRNHSRYVRTVADLPWLGMAVRLELHTRRFFCMQPACRQKIFCERLSTFVAPYARRTNRLAQVFQVLGFALGGEPGARLAQALALRVSPDTLLRCIRRTVFPTSVTPRVLGVDDWAKRKGHSYGTILVDLERRRPIDLLPDREAQTLEQWLQTHPGVELISRDRAAKYAEGARAGAPEAIQVADRWHLLKNLGEAVKRVLTRERASVEHAAQQLRTDQLGQQVTAGEVVLRFSARPETEIEHHRAARYARYCAVKRLQQQGVSQVGIARTLCMNHATVRRFMRAAAFPERVRYRRGSRLDPYLPYLAQRWAQGERDPQQLWREVQAQGYPGTARMLDRYVLRVGQRVKGLSSEESAQFLQVATIFPTPSIRQVTAWMQKPSHNLTPEQAQCLTHLTAASAQVQETRTLALAFRQLMQLRAVAQLPIWLAQAEQSPVLELRSFAVGLRQEYAAVAAALEYRWSNGPVEGHVNRLKTIKRQMYGRANFDLLKARVLHVPTGYQQKVRTAPGQRHDARSPQKLDPYRLAA